MNRLPPDPLPLQSRWCDHCNADTPHGLAGQTSGLSFGVGDFTASVRLREWVCSKCRAVSKQAVRTDD